MDGGNAYNGVEPTFKISSFSKFPSWVGNSFKLVSSIKS